MMVNVALKTTQEIKALRIALVRLVQQLDRSGTLSKADFAKSLRSEAQHAEDTAPPSQMDRHDLALIRAIADALTDPSSVVN